MQGANETRVGIFVLIALLILAYMGFHIGAFRFDRGNYSKYTVYFKDISGLSRKAEVKIAGVKVGWVETINLVDGETMAAEADIYVLKQYELHEDSHAMVRQEGLLGPKYLELVPGDPMLPTIAPGSHLGKPSIHPVLIDDLMHQVKKIASNVESVTNSMRAAVGGEEGKEELRIIVRNIDTVTKNFAEFSEIISRSFVNNESNIDAILQMGGQISRLTTRIEDDLLPTFKDSIERISGVFDRDLSKLSQRLESTAIALEEASFQVRDSFRNVTSVTEKIDEGQGLIGKLVNDDETYEDLKVAAEGLRNYFARVNKMQIVFDTHFETMLRPGENYDFEDSKGYLNVRMHLAQDYFFMLQVVGSEKGFVNRYEIEPSYIDCDGNYIDARNLNLTDNDRIENIFTQRRTIFTRGDVRFGVQLGKIFGDIALRLGMFENAVGAAVDVDVPLYRDKFRWVTTFEAFDFRGWNRRDDRRPHLKWLNRMFFMRNLYFVFGADDFISKRNANIFFGGGMRFGDDDVKYFMSTLAPLAASSAGGGLSQTIAVNQN